MIQLTNWNEINQNEVEPVEAYVAFSNYIFESGDIPSSNLQKLANVLDAVGSHLFKQQISETLSSTGVFLSKLS